MKNTIFAECICTNGNEVFKYKKKRLHEQPPKKDILFLNTKSIDCILGEHISRFQQ